MPPIAVAPETAFARRRWLARIASQPEVDVVVIELFAPEHTGEGLALYEPFIVAQGSRLERSIEGIRLVRRCPDRVVEAVQQVHDRTFLCTAEAQPDRGRHSRRELHFVVRGSFGSLLATIDGTGAAMDDELVDAILDIRYRIGHIIQALQICIVVGEEELWATLEG